MIFSELSKSWY